MSNTAKLNSCPKCGLPIPAGAPQGLCPKCVLQGAATATDAGLPATATSEIPSLERVAAAFPQLEILELIGRGGMGFVFKARQPHLERFVALKLLPDRLARDPRFAERFNREGRVLARLNHPNIVGVYDFGKTEHFYFLLMEYVDGVNLRQAMQAGRFSPAESLGIVPKICEALQYAHDQGILHRDIKPENILLDARGQVKIADFGIAKLLGEDREDVTLTATGSTLGTAHYMAPEQVEKPSEVDHRADIYSLGVVFYEMLTGELPLGRFAAPSSKTPVSAGVDQVVFRTLEKDRERRFQTAGEVGTQVEHLTQTGGLTPDPVSSSATSGAVWSRKALWAAGLVAAALALPVIVFWMVISSDASMSASGNILLLISVVLGILGTVMGWLALSELRASRNRFLGLPIAVFAAVGWPVTILVVLTVSFPWLAMTSMTPGQAARNPWLLVRLVPAGILTFAIWAVYTTVRWANQEAPGPRRKILKWVFIALVLSGFGMVPWRLPALNPWNRVAGAPSVRVALTVPRGQVATLQVMRREGEDFVPVPGLSGYLVAPDDERGRGSVVLKPAEPLPRRGGAKTWRLSVESDEGGRSESGTEFLGELIPIPSKDMRVSIDPNTSTEIVLTRPSESGPANGEAAPAILSLRISASPRGKIGGSQDSITVGAGSTNWATPLRQLQSARNKDGWRHGEVLVRKGMNSTGGAEATNSVRFTFTNVRSREQDGVRWLGFDYAMSVQGDCEETFRMEGATTVTRNKGLMISPGGSPAIRHQSVEWQLPAAVENRTVEELVDDLSKALVGTSLVIAAGEERPLLRLPMGKSGDLTVHIGAIARAR